MLEPTTFTINRSTVAARVLLAMSEDEERPSRLVELARKLGKPFEHVAASVNYLKSLGAVKRVKRGHYVRTVGEVECAQ